VRRYPCSTHAEIALVHGDYRTGTYLVTCGELAAVLDWELLRVGATAHEDVCWSHGGRWRFGKRCAPRQVGIGQPAGFRRGYNPSPSPIAGGRVAYWEIMAAAKWPVIVLSLAGRKIAFDGHRGFDRVGVDHAYYAGEEFDARRKARGSRQT